MILDDDDRTEVSASLAWEKDIWEDVSTPMCNGCKKWHRGKHSCDVYAKGIPEEIRFKEYHPCQGFDINPDSINYIPVKENIRRLKK